jgi:phenylalanyl-tRNA synthetase beta subunit
LNSNPVESSKVIDEYYNPRNLNEKAHLQDLVEEEMRAKGFDPLNKGDVQKYWASKGIQFNG